MRGKRKRVRERDENGKDQRYVEVGWCRGCSRIGPWRDILQSQSSPQLTETRRCSVNKVFFSIFKR